MRIRAFVLVGVSLLLTAVFAPPSGASNNGINNGLVPKFIVDCPFSHRLMDDPIMDPGLPGASHSHDFFGNTSTDASSTLASLQAAPTTCREVGDTAAYWSPTVYQNGVALQPMKATIYYRNVGKDLNALQVFPPGFQMVAGNLPGSKPLPGKMTGWACRKRSGLKGVWTAGVPTCDAGENLVFRVQFPECWNGQLDSADHRSHVARIDRGGNCPAGYPTLIPRVSMTVVYPTLGGAGITLSSGSPIGDAHMDFVNSWNQDELDMLVARCLRAVSSKCRFAADEGDG